MTFIKKRKLITKIWSIMTKIRNVNNLYECAMSQNFPVESFKWVENTSQFSKDFIKNNKEGSDEGYFLELDVQYPKKTCNVNNDLTFFPERMKMEKLKSL